MAVKFRSQILKGGQSMRRRITFCFLLCISSTIAAQSVNITGKVANRAGGPIANAIVTLVKQALRDTTGTDGAYKLSVSAGIELPLLVPKVQSITMYKDFLDFSLPNPASVKVEIFNVQGNLLKKEFLPNASKGFYRFNVEDDSRTANVLVVRVSLGHEAYTFRYFPLRNGAVVANQSNGSGARVDKKGLAKITAITDTLRTTANGFMTNVKAINSYSQVVDVTLDSAGGAKPSSGCGKARTLPDSSSTTISIAGTNRLYILDIPHDYDPNTPCALWFSFHCAAGTAEGVAHGSFGTNYQYYGIRKFANPKNGKGTTIFCAPQGTGNLWSNPNGQDVEFVRQMVKKFESELCIDQSRIFAEGFSMGGAMSYTLGCAMPDTFRAVCMHEGGGMPMCSQPNRGPVAIFITHATDDSWPGAGAPQLKDFAQQDSCTPMDVASMINPKPDLMHPICAEYKNCMSGFPCRACIFTGGHTPSPGTEGAWGEGNTWVPDSTWSFFKRFY